MSGCGRPVCVCVCVCVCDDVPRILMRRLVER